MTQETPIWHTEDATDVLTALQTDKEDGLTDAQVKEKQAQHGPNALSSESGRRPWQILAAQFANILVAILIAAAIISFALKDIKDGIAILAIVILNAILGFRQEFSAEKAMAALRKMSSPKARVRRGGSVTEIDAEALVPGDIVLLEAGNLIPADCRLIENASLHVQESALTGESEAVEKHVDAITDQHAGVGDRRNMLYMGTVVTYGRAEGVVTDIGMATQLGQVANLLQSTEDEATPLTRKIHQLGKMLISLSLVLISIVVIMGLLRGEPWQVVFLTAVSMAVAAVPEGLPAVVTIALALGAKRMLARNALVRSLPAVETLGAVTTICTDKTGTLTQNRMTATVAALPGSDHKLSDATSHENPDVLLCIGAAALCTDANLQPATDDGILSALGDPTEGALVVAAAEAGMLKNDMEALLPRIAEAPFDSDRKRMATAHRVSDTQTPTDGSSLARFLSATDANNADSLIMVKGAVDSILPICTRIRRNEESIPLTDADRSALEDKMDTMAAGGIRVLGVAYRASSTPVDSGATPEDLESNLVYLGMIGMMDPLRNDVPPAVHTCQQAGIRPVMITGDHPAMARCIGSELGLQTDQVFSGKDMENADETALRKAAADVSVYARVSPEHKLRIVDALQERGDIVAMTGDGVNDAPALKSADIGVAMGITGTDVAKGAADMVLLDDRYATIVAAVREGRVIFDNILRFIRFILASNTGELLVMLTAPMLGMPLPLLPVQILWMNLVTDGLPALALGVEKPERDVMERPPRDPQRPIVTWKMAIEVLAIGALITILSFAAGHGAGDLPSTYEPVTHAAHSMSEATTWQTMIFSTMVFAQLFLALAVRSTRDSVFRIGFFSNPALIGAVLLTFVLQLAVLYVPVLQDFFHTVPLSQKELGLCLSLGAVVFLAVEAAKTIYRLVHHFKRT